MRTLEEVAPLLGHAYGEWKQYEGRKNEYKNDFFALADKALKGQTLATKVVEVEAETLAQARARVERHHSAWLIGLVRKTYEGRFEIVLNEDPSLKPFSFEWEGVKYARTVSRGAVMIDDDWLAEAEPDLYEQVTIALPWGDRMAIPVEHLPAVVIGRLSRFLYNAKPTARLAAPRPVKAEEEEDV